MNSLGKRLKKCREYKKLSQESMAKLLNCSMRAFQTYERDERFPNAETLTHLLKEGFNINWLLSGEGKMIDDPDTSSLDRDLLTNIINLVEGELANSKYQIPPHRKASVYFQLHDEIKKSGANFNDKVDEIISLFNALAKF